MANDPNWTDVLTAIGTVGAVIVALAIALSARARESRQRPVLRLLYEHQGSDDFRVGLFPTYREQHVVRMRVANRWGRRSADDVEVVIVEVRRDDDTSDPLEGHSLPWANVFSADSPVVTRLTIPPGAARHFDMLVLDEPTIGDGYNDERAVPGVTDAWVKLRIATPFPKGDFTYGAGKTTIVLALTARDTDTVYYMVSVLFDGKWWGARQIRDHLRVFATIIPYAVLEPDEGSRQFERAYYGLERRVLMRLHRLNPLRRIRERRVRRDLARHASRSETTTSALGIQRELSVERDSDDSK